MLMHDASLLVRMHHADHDASLLVRIHHGTSALATAGTGDVLAGILSASIAQGLNINDAAVYSAYIHAECACQYSKNVSRHGLTASDLIDMLPFAQEEIFHVL